jgi:hypothetical protein
MTRLERLLADLLPPSPAHCPAQQGRPPVAFSDEPDNLGAQMRRTCHVCGIVPAAIAEFFADLP